MEKLKAVFLVSVLALVSGVSSVACAGLPLADALYDGSSLQPTALADVIKNVGPGSVLIVSEQHGNQKHYANQKAALRELQQGGRCTVSVGLEFLSYTDQTAITSYSKGSLAEADFLKAVGWGGNPFADYRDQAQFPSQTGGELLGINAPRSLTGTIAKKGLSALTPDEQRLMPPNFQMGRAEYRERFEQVMGGHIAADAMERYFAAQSVWDETMAWTSAEFLAAHPSHCLVIVVGDFHAQYGGGLPDRLRARGVQSVTVLSQIEGAGLTESELQDEAGPNQSYGPRADGVWVSVTP